MAKNNNALWWIVFIILALVIGYIIGKTVTGNATASYSIKGTKIVPESGSVTSTIQCKDKADNDGDGKIDYPADSGCSSPNDNTEASCVSGSTTCGVGACLRSSTCINDQVSCTPGTPTTETCNNLDDDCNGLIDDSLNQQCGVSDVGQCKFGTQTCSSGSWGSCIGAVNPTNETCDGLDNDCNGLIDDGITCTTPDSCADSDGGYVITVQGTASGYKNNVYYTRTDYCYTSTYLNEYYCSGTSVYNSSTSCSGNGTTSCSAGRCI
ncbi:hypothetical protein HY212_06510 [Candidatus Pacearchaeota archaeon]|nr:hypothetical protein [Candidatus Pacearchaeota archaeon]